MADVIRFPKSEEEPPEQEETVDWSHELVMSLLSLDAYGAEKLTYSQLATLRFILFMTLGRSRWGASISASDFIEGVYDKHMECVPTSRVGCSSYALYSALNHLSKLEVIYVEYAEDSLPRSNGGETKKGRRDDKHIICLNYPGFKRLCGLCQNSANYKLIPPRVLREALIEREERRARIAARRAKKEEV